MRKSLVFVVLGIPVLIAVVLKFFGQNQYEIPIYFKEGICNEQCNLQTTEQYTIPDLRTNDEVVWQSGDVSTLFFFAEGGGELDVNTELLRVVLTNPDTKRLNIYKLTDEVVINEVEGIDVLQFSGKELEELSECVFFVSQYVEGASQSPFIYLILADKEGRIRGYYDSSNPEEYDRLSAEIDILELEG